MSASAEMQSHGSAERAPLSSGTGGGADIDRLLTVLESVAAPGPTIKFIDQVVSEAPSDIEFRYFSWRIALFGKYDVFHVHWPEFLIRGSRGWVSLARRTLFRALLLRLRVTRTRIVRTMHNLEPHTKGDATEARLLDRLDSMTSAWVRINVVTAFPPEGDHYTVLHGSYRHQFATLEKPPQIKGRLLYIGRIEPYKGVEDLARAFAADAEMSAHLRIVGKASEALRDSIGAVAAGDPRIECDFEFVSDERLVAEICEAELVVLPYREMHNSGIALVALSLNRPVLVPDSPSNEALANEVGSGWVLRFTGEITGDVIRSALTTAREARTAVPALEKRDWAQVAHGYAAAFRGELEATE